MKGVRMLQIAAVHQQLGHAEEDLLSSDQRRHIEGIRTLHAMRSLLGEMCAKEIRRLEAQAERKKKEAKRT